VSIGSITLLAAVPSLIFHLCLLHKFRFMKRIFLFLLLASSLSTVAQEFEKIVSQQDVSRIIGTLAADDMQGRKVFTPGIDKAANFIAAEFQSIGLKPFAGNNFRQEFVMVRPKFISASGTVNGTPLTQGDIMVVTCKADLQINEKSGYEKVAIKAGEDLFTKAQQINATNKNTLVVVDKSFASNFKRLGFLKRAIFKKETSLVFVLTDADATTYEIKSTHEIKEENLFNVAGMIPGKSKKDEYVIFSGHYDHLGIGKAVDGDSIYNGANDDAAGTTAVIALAKYYKAMKNNERTLLFVAFTAEESGGYGAQYFSKQLVPEKVMAMFNIEMIGTESKWGKNSAYITGFDKSDMGALLQKSLEGTGFNFYPDPYPNQQLFYRSDNATLARLGVPAHTISTAKMDAEPFYHKPGDEVSTLDLTNMTAIIKSIALSATAIVSGKATPSRVDTSTIR